MGSTDQMQVAGEWASRLGCSQHSQGSVKRTCSHSITASPPTLRAVCRAVCCRRAVRAGGAVGHGCGGISAAVAVGSNLLSQAD